MFHIAMTLSLLLCLAMAALWVRSYHYNDYWHLWQNHVSSQNAAGHDWHFSIRSQGGGIRAMFLHTNYSFRGTLPPDGLGFQHIKSISTGQSRLTTFAAAVLKKSDFSDVWPGATFGGIKVEFPDWLPMLLAVPVVWRFWRKQLLRRRLLRLLAAGHCPVCGYNLTGNISGTCPECGTAITVQ
jgi:hypothetical protein